MQARSLTIRELPPPNLTTAEGVGNFWRSQMNGQYGDPNAKVIVALPKDGSENYLTATVEAALELQRSMGPQRFQFADNLASN